VPADAGTPRIGSPVGGIFDSRPDAVVGHRFIIKARDDMQVGVEPGWSRLDRSSRACSRRERAARVSCADVLSSRKPLTLDRQ
jgi:hypothetical protein